MQLNYHFLKRLVPELAEALEKTILSACFSQERDELILAFERPEKEDFYIRATLTSSFSCLSFPEDFKRSRKNSVNLFPKAIGQTVKSLRLYDNERAFLITLETESLLFKLHGNRSNILLTQGNVVTELFKNQLKGDQTLEPEALDRPIERVLDLYLENPDYKSFYPTFGAIPAQYLKESGFEKLNPESQWKMLLKLDREMEKTPFYLIDFQNKPGFSLIPLGKAEILGDSAMEAATRFFKTFTSRYFLALEKRQAESELNKRLKQTESYIRKSEARLEKLKADIQPEQIADILMANLHQIPTRQKKVTLFNFYSDQDIEIKLNPELSPQKNAEQYYRKSKNLKIEVEKTEANVFGKYEMQEAILGLLQELSTINDIRGLRKWLKENGLVKTMGSSATESVPYKAFEIGSYQVWVGKNAKANDELSLKYAYKEDLWLHAKDVPGSHVLIKDKSGNKTPKEVIEKAASLAAWYSKRKTDSLVPVIVTAAKFVRKRKGAPPGQVIVAKENVVLVEPLSPDKL